MSMSDRIWRRGGETERLGSNRRGLVVMLWYSWQGLFPLQGGWPNTISYNNTPTDHTSHLLLNSSLFNIYGHMYRGVPTLENRPKSSMLRYKVRAKPKSVILRRDPSRSRLAGLMSRWMMLRLCSSVKPQTTQAQKETACSQERRLVFRCCFRSPSGQY